MADVSDYSRQVLASMDPAMSPAATPGSPPPALPPIPYGPPPPPRPMPPPAADPIPSATPPGTVVYGEDPILRFNGPAGEQPGIDVVQPTVPPPRAPLPPPPPPVQPTSAATPQGPPGPVVMRGAVSPSREIPGIGPTQAALVDHATATRLAAEEHAHALEQAALTAQYQAAQAREKQAQADQAGAEQARAQFQQNAQKIAEGVHADTQRLASMKVDPNRVWKTQGAAGNVAAVLAVALGGFAQGFSGGRVPNTALEILNKRIDDDIAAQRANIENARNALDVRRSEFGQLVQKYGMSGAEQMWGAAHAERLASQAEQMASQHGISQSDANYQRVVGALRAEADERKAAAIKYVQASGGQPMVFDPRIGVPVPMSEYGKMGMDIVKGVTLEQAKADGTKDDKTQEEAGKLAKELQQAGVPTGMAVATRAQKDQATAPDVSRVKIGTVKAAEHYMGGGIANIVASVLYDPSERKREQSWAAFQNQGLHALTGAGMSDTEAKRLMKQYGDQSTNEGRANALNDFIEQMRAAQANAFAGASPAARQKYNEGHRAVTATDFTETK